VPPRSSTGEYRNGHFRRSFFGIWLAKPADKACLKNRFLVSKPFIWDTSISSEFLFSLLPASFYLVERLVNFSGRSSASKADQKELTTRS
jgi:hypothetical protein